MQINILYLLFLFFLILLLCISLLFQRVLFQREAFENNDIFMDVVVARYAEDLAWIKGTIDPNTYNNMYVYNKGDEFECDLPKSTVKELKNVGREGHTYLTYIVENYDNLPDVVVFVPGSCGTNADKMTKLKMILDHLKTNKTSVIAGNKSREDIKLAKNFSLDNWDVTSPENKMKNPESKVQPSTERPLHKWFEKKFGEDEKLNCVTFQGVLAASRVDIQKRPKEWYETLRADMLHPNPETGHYVERTWKHIFSMDDEHCIG